MRALFTLFFILLFSVVAVGQLTISGPQQVCQGNTYVYSVSGASGGTGGIGMGSYTWSLNNSNIGSGLSVNVTIPSTATADELKVIYVEGRSLSSFQTETIYLNKPYPGIVNLNSNSTICYGQSASISVGLQRLGPNGNGNFQKRTGSVWQDISAPGTSITVPNLTTDTDFRFKISNSCGTQYSNVVSVSVKPALNPGGITNAQTICYNGNPSTLGSSSSASNGIGGYSYQWQKRPAGSNWQNISGANSTSYNPPTLTTTHDYRRRVISCGQTKYTNTIRVTVKSPLSPGGINNAQTVCYGGNPSTLGNSSSASNGLGGYTYQWQIKSPSGSWSNISGATSTTYNPPTLTATRDYRRRVISCGQTKYTNIIRVTVLPSLSPGSINNAQTVCYGGNPSTLGNSSSALNGLGGYSYQWQISTDGGSNFSNISGATSTTYNPPSLTATRDYRRRVISCGQTKYSNTVRVTVKSPLTAGSINGAQTVCYSGNPSTLGNSSSPSNGLGGYNYQWEIKSPSGSWSSISGATSSTHNPPSLTATRDYRRKVVSCGQTQYSNTIRITVKSALDPGNITNAQTVCYGDNPDALGSSSSASNGLGGYSYQWQSKASGGSWSNLNGETSTTYNPPSLNETRDYRRRVISCGQTKYTNVISVTVRPNLVAGSINGDKSICYNATAGTLGNSSSASGGNGSYTYQWQRRSPGGSWANISGETSTLLSPGNLNDDTEFRRRVYSCGQYKYSNVVTINVFNQVSTPTTSSYGRCGPGVINLNPSVGSGGNTIRWYNSSSGGSHFTQALEYAPDLSTDQTYYISSYSTLTGCESSRVAINAVINPEPNVDAGSTLTYYEFENSVNLSGTGESPQGGNYSGSYVNNDNFDLSQSGTGSYTVFYNYINTEGCPGTDSKTIIVEDNPDITVNGNNEIVWGESRTLSVPAGFASYQWYRNDQAISGATSNIYEAGSVGEYKVNITADNNNSMMVSPKNIINNASLQNENFVQTINYKVKASEGQGMREIGEVNEQITYFDGLGRKFQTVMTQASPNKKDLVAPIQYDELGRPSKEFLPYVPQKNDGLVDHAALRGSGDEYVQSSQYSFYAGGSSDQVANTTVPYAETVYENSPLNRPVAQYAPGEDWGREGNANPVTTAYEINSASDQVIRFEVDGNTLQIDGEYGNGFFQKTIVTDENGNKSATFTDPFGKTILKRNLADGENFDTYYVYDFYDNLRFVIPPEAVHQLSTGTGQFPSNLLDQFVFQYRYDNRDRMIWKKVPGAEPVIMIYDERDRLVLTQDGKQAITNLFSFTKYDALNRPIMTGEKEINNSIPNLRDLLNGNDWLQNYDAYETLGGSKYGYTSNSLPKNLDLDEIHTVTYYDNYDFRSEISLDGVEYDYSGSGTENAFEQTDFVKGQVTGSLTRVLGASEMLASVNYYDERYRLLQNISQKKDGNLITSNNSYDFTGNVLETVTDYHVNNENYSIIEDFEYDHMNRLISVTHQLNNDPPVLMLSNQYNELGELINKKLHQEISSFGGTEGGFAQSVDYRYNIRGWLTRINHADLSADNANEKTDLFGMELGYTDNLGTSASPQLNGNIAAVKWSSNLGMGEELAAYGINIVNQRAYGFEYDGLNRILGAGSHERVTGFDQSPNFSMDITAYDFNGNILGLTRKDGSGNNMDTLEYHYGKSNQLKWVKDYGNVEEGFKDGNPSGTDYLYDANGNMTSDANKKIDSIFYNHLNLPDTVVFEDGKQLVFVYDATGTKLQQQTITGDTVKTTDYLGAMYLENDTLQFISTAEGRVVPNGTGWEYQYYLKDHLGNVRTTFTTRPKTEAYGTGFETATVPNGYFDNYEDQHRDNYLANTGTYSSRLSYDDNLVIGLAKSLKVYPGDTVRATAHARVLDTSTEDASDLVAQLASGFTNAFAGNNLGIEGQVNSFSDLVYPPSGTGGLLDKDDTDDTPKLYLNLLYFDKDMNFITGSFARSSSVATSTFEALSLELLVPMEGYILIYLSNEEEQANIAYFDDIDIAHHHSPVIQEESYYPFGLSQSVGFQRNLTKEQRFGYNGKEKQEETGWYDYGARMYQADLGRWNGMDELAEIYHTDSPYSYVLNNPLKFIDPDGRKVEGVTKKDAEKTHEDLNTIFAGEQFDAFRSLITRSGRKGNGKRFNSIDSDALARASEGLEGDDLALVNLVAGAINSDDVHKVEYAGYDEALSEGAIEGYNGTVDKINEQFGQVVLKKATSMTGKNVSGGSGINYPVDGGSHSVIRSDVDYRETNGRRDIVTMHEVFGHGIPSAKRASDEINNRHAIQTENLVRRVLQIKEQRDGSNHAGGKISNPSALPKF